MIKKAASRLFSFFCAALLLCAVYENHHAIEGLWGAPRALPSDEERFFYDADTTYLPRQYVTNGAPGYTAFYEIPESDTLRGYVENNIVFTGKYFYGPQWILAVGVDGKHLGWVRASETYALPDAVSFEQQYGHAILSFDEALNDDPLAFNRAFTEPMWAYVYSYPGSGEVISRIGRSILLTDLNPAESYTQFYRDGGDRLWFQYSSPFCDGWICLSDPGNHILPADPAITFPAPDIVPPAERTPSVYHLRDWHILVILAAVAVAAPILRRLYRCQILQKTLGTS